MILQALNRYYEMLAADPESGIASYGYSTAAVSFELVLSPDGELLGITHLFQTEQQGKKLVERPLNMIVPEQPKRSGSAPPPYFLCDNPKYVLGVSDESGAEKRFQAFREYNLSLLEGIDCPEAQAVRAFLTGYDPARAREYAPVDGHWDDLLKGGNIVFRLDGSKEWVHNAPAIRRAWEQHKASAASEKTGQCLVTGEIASIARLHPNLKGVRGANSTGASLVGFNAAAYESYGLRQGYNAQTSEKAAFQYGAALNYLLSSANPNPKIFLGDTTIVYWAESPDRGYVDLFALLTNPTAAGPAAGDAPARRDPQAEARLRATAEKIQRGEPVDKDALLSGLDPNTRFYVLGLAPNVSRAAVRFFHQDLFGRIIDRLLQHYQDLQIEREFANQPVYIPPWMILNETVSKKSRDKDPAPLLGGAFMRAILDGTPYPVALFYAIINRIRVDQDDNQRKIHKINYLRAAVIKAYLTRKYRHYPQSPIKEVLQMSLNEQSTHPAYLLGRLFAVLEKVQEEAIPNVNATIKDRFFSSACASPVTVFPRLLRLSQHHLAKLSTGNKIWYEKLMSQIMDLLSGDKQPFPANLPLDNQGVFVLGYYHQRAAFFKPRKDVASDQTSETETISMTRS
ncbi:MAG: type I-C CRISPR-associated protein Cas8c/Csd1 [Chloroflexi bacterium]|nr:type I-C CRISPR-associated protein Cas8c/Csd1 [Chloroflexota bacterium]